MNPDHPRWTKVAIALVLSASLIALITFLHYGATWDEEHSLGQGERVLRWYLSGFADRRAIDEHNFRYYGGFFNVLVQLTSRLGGLPLYETSHLVTAIFGLTGLALTYWVGSRVADRLAGLIAVVFLWTTPLYYGHSFNNPKDLPFAVMSLASFAAMVACWDHLPRLPARLWLATAVTLGLALGIRVGGVLNFAWLALSWAAWLVTRAYPFTPGRRHDAAAALRPLAVNGLRIAGGAWLVMLVWWPYAQVDPIRNPVDALGATARFRDWVKPVRFMGLDIPSDQLPWWYVPVWFGVTLPEFYFVAGLLGLLLLPSAVASLIGGTARPRQAVFLLLATLAVAVPVSMAITSRAILYDGIRHLLFVVPLMAILAGAAVSGFLQRLGRSRLRGPVLAVVAGCVLVTVVDMVRLHPYQSVYFNRAFGGGLGHAAARFETDYWGQSYKEAVDWVAAHYRPATTEKIRVANCSKPFLSAYYLEKTPELRARFLPVDPGARPHLMLATTRWSCHQLIKGRVLHVVERSGAPLCYVIEVQAPPAAGAAPS